MGECVGLCLYRAPSTLYPQLTDGLNEGNQSRGFADSLDGNFQLFLGLGGAALPLGTQVKWLKAWRGSSGAWCRSPERMIQWILQLVMNTYTYHSGR